jgi:hypothetical protein
MTEKFDEMMRHINNLVTRVEQVEQRPPPAHEDDDRDTDRMTGTQTVCIVIDTVGR